MHIGGGTRIGPLKAGNYCGFNVGTIVGDIPKFLKDGETALLAEQRNKDEFASKLIWALENPTLAKIVGKNGAQIALRNFNSHIETKKMLDVFSQKRIRYITKL